MTTASPRKLRSRSVRLSLLGAAAFGVAGCLPEDVSTEVFPSIADCRAAAQDGTGEYSAQECDEAFALAEAAHAETAPRYDELVLCEEQHGGECIVDPAVTSSGGGSIFMPLMMGYMMGSMMNNGRATMGAQPLYRTASGTYSTPSGATNLTSNRGAVSLAPTSFRPAAPTSAAQPMSRATVAASGGFGAGRTGSGPSGFGG